MSETPRFHQYREVPVTFDPDISDNTTLETRSSGEYNVAWLQKAWQISKRPFYNVYPSVVDCLSNTSLAFSLRQLTRFFAPTAICFAVGHELRLDNQVKATSVIVNVMPSHGLGTGVELDSPVCQMVANVIFPDGGTGTLLSIYYGDDLLSDIADAAQVRPALLRLCLGVIMLSKDPEFAVRILLNRDRKRIDRLNTPEKMKLAVDRAIRNGRNGWTIGEHLEVSPHTRRPHFAIRWTGPGRLVPKLRPIKGCIVKSSRIYPIPTGYMDEKNP